MRGLRYDRILAGTALALILALAPLSTHAQSNNAELDAAVPMPSGAPLPPPNVNDVTGQPAPVAPPAAGPVVTPPAPQPVNAAPVETAAPDPYASLDPADRPIAEKIHELLTARVDKIFPNKKERSAVEAFYQNRNLAPLWLDRGVENARARSTVARLKQADADGLEVSDYKTPDFAAAASPDALAEAELKFTATVLTYARHVQAGRFPYTRISANNIDLPQLPPDTAEILTKLADARNVASALDEYSPPQEGYKALKAALADLRVRTGAPASQIADGQVLKVNRVPMEDPRVPQLRERLGVTGDATDLKYDAKLAEAVKKFQRSNELPVTGNLDSKTVATLNGPPRDKQINTVIANMERWRWMPRDLGGRTYVMVNLPDFTLKVVHNGTVAWTTRVVVGKPSLPTPLLFAQMKYITVNPTWNVPPSIVQNEYLPALKQDPTVLARMGLKVVNNPDGSVHIYQPPGDGNALGRVRFNFPNRFLVYQHDTPDKNLFSHDTRAYSHGCMRVQDPAKYAEVLLSIVRPGDGYTQERIRKMYGSAEQDIQFPTFIPVNLTYQTAFVDDQGKLVMRNDMYGLDTRMLNAIKNERGMIEVAAERPRETQQSSGTRPARVQQQQQVSIFQQLFGGFNNPPPPAAKPKSRVR